MASMNLSLIHSITILKALRYLDGAMDGAENTMRSLPLGTLSLEMDKKHKNNNAWKKRASCVSYTTLSAVKEGWESRESMV